jgi:hypothetical protein
MKNKSNLFLAPYGFKGSLVGKKIKTRIHKVYRYLRKSHQKTYPLDPGSGKNSSRIRIPGGKRHQVPDPDQQHCVYICAIHHYSTKCFVNI